MSLRVNRSETRSPLETTGSVVHRVLRHERLRVPRRRLQQRHLLVRRPRPEVGHDRRARLVDGARRELLLQLRHHPWDVRPGHVLDREDLPLRDPLELTQGGEEPLAARLLVDPGFFDHDFIAVRSDPLHRQRLEVAGHRPDGRLVGLPPALGVERLADLDPERHDLGLARHREVALPSRWPLGRLLGLAPLELPAESAAYTRAAMPLHVEPEVCIAVRAR